MAEDRIPHHQNISGVSAQNYSQVFAGSAQNVYFTNPPALQEPLERAAIECRNAFFLTDPHIDRESLITAKGTRVSGTCEWIINDVAYRAWLTCGGNDINESRDKSRLLWISGGPGKGKTMLSIFLTEELKKHTAHTENSELMFFFCSAQDEKRNTAVAVLRGLLHQIVTKRPQLIKHALPYFETLERKAQTLSSLEALWVIFSKMTSDIEFGTMFCVLDGLDECEESTRRVLVSKLVSLLKDPKTSEQSLVRLAIISRDIPGLQDCPRIQLDPDNDKKVANDIEQFVSARVKELSHIKGFNDDPQKSAYVQRELLSRAEGTFLWVGFAMHELLQKHTWTDVLCSLKKLPSGLPAIYSRMLLGIPNEHKEMSRLILRWVTLAVRPLNLKELAAATNIQSSSHPCITEHQAILDAISHCRPLLQMQKGKISFVHQSARDYLLREEQNNDKAPEEFRVDTNQGHLEVLKTCISCMIQGGLQHSPIPLHGEIWEQESSLLDYAIFHWPEHAKGCSARDVALSNTLKQFFREDSLVLRHWWAFHNERKFLYLPYNLPLFHMQCWLELIPLVEKVAVSEKWKPRFLKRINSRDSEGHTALHLAVKTGNRDLVRILIDNGAIINVKTIKKTTPLHMAANLENAEILQLLIDNRADIDVENEHKRTALHLATDAGREATVGLLLERGADANAKDKSMMTALHFAAFHANKKIARLLSDGGANTNAKEEDGRTALHLAALSMSEEVVSLLLDRGADANANDEGMQTALHTAAFVGNEKVARLLLDGGANIKAKDEYGRTALHIAALSWSEEVVRLLLDRGAEVNAKDESMMTALHLAVSSSRVPSRAIVQLLIHRGTDVNVRSHGGITILQTAVNRGDETLVQLLKEYGCK